MRYVFADEDVSFVVPLNPPADPDTVRWTLRDNDGVVIHTNQPVANEDGAETATITIDADDNAKTLDTESRFLIVNWSYATAAFQSVHPYVLIDFMALRAQPSDVRSLLALNTAELEDAEIDLPQAATLTRSEIGSEIFDAALIAGDLSTDQINRAVACKAAVLLMPSLAARISASMGAPNGARFTRLQKLDPEAIALRLNQEYASLLSTLTEAVDVDGIIFTKTTASSLFGGTI